jgi:Uma2 family endonuclease
MAPLTIELPTHVDQTAFNLRRWADVVADPELARIGRRIETDRHGNIITSPPPAASHGRFQSRIAQMLERLMGTGESVTECPISTADGVRAADVAWASADCLADLGNKVCFPKAPEICVEILSPANSASEIKEKKALYFNAGAKEVWVCDAAGRVTFYSAGQEDALNRSALCPDFPKKLTLQ